MAPQSLSKRLILSYVFDWVIILAIAAVGGAWNFITPYKRPISLVDLSISFPYQNHETVPFWVAIVAAMIAPGVIILVVSLFFIPGPTATRNTPRALIWRRKLWEWNTGWMGLGLSLATAFVITQGMKNLIGKARPDLLSRCQPDLENFERFVVGGLGQTLDPRWVRVSANICTSTHKAELDDGFRSWPSGHASFSWAGLLYLTLFFCSKFAIAIPFLPPRSYSQDARQIALEAEDSNTLPLYKERSDPPISTKQRTASDGLTVSSAMYNPDLVPIRNQAAAPPAYLLVLALVPIGGAAYISATRYTDFRHHGIDLVSGSIIGIVCAWFSFRWYHLPIRQGAGWAWGARSRDRAFGIGVGMGTYVGLEGWVSKKAEGQQMERRRNTTDAEASGVMHGSLDLTQSPA